MDLVDKRHVAVARIPTGNDAQSRRLNAGIGLTVTRRQFGNRALHGVSDVVSQINVATEQDAGWRGMPTQQFSRTFTSIRRSSPHWPAHDGP